MKRLLGLGIPAIAALLFTPLAAESAIVAGPIENPANGHDYYLLSESSWTAAEQEAVGLGGHLVTINDQQEQDWVWAAFGNYGGVHRSLWIGLNDVATEGQFVWASGEPVDYTNWLQGQPDNNTPIGEDYVHMMGNDRNAVLPFDYYGKWNDYQNSDAAYTSYNFGPLHGVVEVPHAITKDAKNLLWQIDQGASRIFILGSIHALRSTDLPFPDSLTQAFNQSSKVYFEADLDAAASPSFQNYFVSLGSYPSGENLQSKLSSATYAKIQDFASQHGLQTDYFRPFRPWFVSALISSYANTDLGILVTNGVDRHFYDLAQSQGRTRAYLETPEQQIDLFAGAPESEWLSALTLQMENTEAGSIATIENWKAGNAEALAASNEVTSAQAPGIYSNIITTRNENWLGTVTNALSTAETTLFVVGAAHTVGQDGLPSRLASMGYVVRRLPLIPVRLFALKAVREIPGVQTNELNIPIVESDAAVVEIPAFTDSRIRLVATAESKPNVTNTWYRNGLVISGQTGSELDTGFPQANSQLEFNLKVADIEGSRSYNRVRIVAIQPDIPPVRVVAFSVASGFRCYASVQAGRRYQVDVTETLQPGGSWRWFADLVPATSGEVLLPVLPWSDTVPTRFYRILETY